MSVLARPRAASNCIWVSMVVMPPSVSDASMTPFSRMPKPKKTPATASAATALPPASQGRMLDFFAGSLCCVVVAAVAEEDDEVDGGGVVGEVEDVCSGFFSSSLPATGGVPPALSDSCTCFANAAMASVLSASHPSNDYEKSEVASDSVASAATASR